MIDGYNRTINYLRVSITDRCNLRCIYCMPKEGLSFIGHEDILRYEEILRIVNVAVKNGIIKVRVTGGRTPGASWCGGFSRRAWHSGRSFGT